MLNPTSIRYSETRARPLSRGWFVTPRPNPQAQLRLFCFPYAGGNATIYVPWASILPAPIEVVGVQPPGRAERLREAPHTELSALISALAAAIAPDLDRPFAFFGHSMGALVAFELARTLQLRHGISPEKLIVSGHTAPHIPPQRPPIYDRPDGEFIDQLRKLNGTPHEVFEHEELLQLLLPMLRADFAVCETYRHHPGPTLDCPIVALGGLEDRDVSRDALTAWGKQTTASYSVRMLPGDHFFINSSRQLLLQVIARELSR